jgi:nicotinamide-nucleotide amidase
MRAEILAVGSELLTPQRSDTNSLFLTERLRAHGVDVALRVTVGDDPRLLEQAFRAALSRADLVISTGGLGPTEDDLTREAAAAALDRTLVRDPRIEKELVARFASFGREMAQNNAKQADLIDGAEEIPNRRGTAPGQRYEADGRLLVLLPGPPREMKPLFEAAVLPWVRSRTGTGVLVTRVLRIASMGESDVDSALAPLYTQYGAATTTILSHPGQVELHVTAQGSSTEQAEALIEPLTAQFRERLPGRIFSEDGSELPEVVGRLLVERGLTLAVAESCTGGLLGARLTEAAGATAFFERGFVTYSNRSKVEMLGVDADLIDEHGAVSEPVAMAMAEGARQQGAGASVGLAITGVAGPDGGSEEKPVGLVFLAVCGVTVPRARRVRFFGDRARVRFQSTQAVLEMLRRDLLGGFEE